MINKIHIKDNPRLYNIWRDMKHRCDNPNLKNYKHYGGRGIKYTPEWSNYHSFYVWAINNGYKENLTLDRIDVNSDYSPENCRWADMTIQNANRRAYGSTEYIGVRLRSNKSSYVTSIKSKGKIIFLYSSRSKNDCAIKRNEFIRENNLLYPLNEIKLEFEDICHCKNEKIYIAKNISTGECVQFNKLNELADALKITRQFIQQCISGKRKSTTYIFERLNAHEDY